MAGPVSSEPGGAELVPLKGELVVGDAFAGGQSDEERVFVAWMLRQKTDNTRDNYARAYRQFRAWLAERGVEVLAAETTHISAWQRYLEVTPNAQTGKPLAAKSVAAKVEAVSSFYNRARRLKVIEENPADDADRPEIAANFSPTPAMTAEEARRLIATAFDRVGTAKYPDMRRVADRDADMAALLMATGLRVTECVNARVEDLGYDGGMRVLYVTRKGGKRDAVALGAAAEQIDRRVAGRTSGPIFMTRTGRPVARQWVLFMVKRLAVAAAIPQPGRLTVHALRATFATLSLEYGTDLVDLQDAMGHSDPRTTLGYVRRRNKILKSPVHEVSRQLLADRPDQKERLF